MSWMPEAQELNPVEVAPAGILPPGIKLWPQQEEEKQPKEEGTNEQDEGLSTGFLRPPHWRLSRHRLSGLRR
jgi:hypothetical protein